MTYYTIPLDSTFPWFQTRITLSGITYTLTFRYNSRSTRWVMDIGDASNNPIQLGLVLLINVDLTYQYRPANISLPVGTFFVQDNTGQGIQPTQYSFGTTHTLFYGDPTS
jgi:hypothetical protein